MLIREGVVKLDPWLSPFKDSLRRRFSKTQEWIQKLNDTEGGLEKFSRVRNWFSRQSPHIQLTRLS